MHGVIHAPAAAEAAATRRRALPFPLPRLDARWFQIAFLGSLLLGGALLRDFALSWQQVALCFAAGLATQAIWIKALGLTGVGYLSALVTCLGVSILVRADSLWVHPLLAAAALSSKFAIRWRGKHIFNPGNLAVVLAIAVAPGAWASPGQWGSDVLFALWFAALGVTVTTSARRLDIAWFFLGAFAALAGARVLYLGQSHDVLFHQLGSGALIMFAFFMISDPMTTPNRRSMRLLYAALVAFVAFLWQFAWFQPNGPVWALFLLSPLVPLLDRLFPAPKHVWKERRSAEPEVSTGVTASAPNAP